MLKRLEKTLHQVRGGNSELYGSISIGMPIEFGNYWVLPLLNEFGKKHPDVQFRIKLDYASVMNDALLKGELDFAFVDDYLMDKRIDTTPIREETLELCVHADKLKEYQKKYQKKTMDKRFFEHIEYVEYQEGYPIISAWMAHHIQHRNLNIKVRATVMDVQAVSKLILSGLGAGVIPGYLYQQLKKQGAPIYRFTGCGKPLLNQISLAVLRQRSQSILTETLIQYLTKSLVAK